MSEPSFSFGEKWRGRCFICQTQYDKYTTDQSLCKVCINSYRGHKFFKQLFDIESCFATIIPEPKQIPNELLKQGYNDILLRSGENNADSREFFKEFFSQKLPLPCGQPSLFEVPHLAKFSGFGQVHTLDLSPYLWSGTLKDLRLWGVCPWQLSMTSKTFVCGLRGQRRLQFGEARSPLELHNCQ